MSINLPLGALLLFGAATVGLPPGLLAVVVPLLMVPQATHYVLDGLLWRRKDTRRLPAQRRALGLGGENTP